MSATDEPTQATPRTDLAEATQALYEHAEAARQRGATVDAAWLDREARAIAVGYCGPTEVSVFVQDMIKGAQPPTLTPDVKPSVEREVKPEPSERRAPRPRRGIA